ncbi:MAG: hypothetical protein ACRDZ6_08020, partial [Acidimicrobiales bacterium]
MRGGFWSVTTPVVTAGAGGGILTGPPNLDLRAERFRCFVGGCPEPRTGATIEVPSLVAAGA